MNVGSLIEHVLGGDDLSAGQAQELMAFLISGSASDAQIGGVLVALKAKGVSGRELAAFVRAMQDSSLRLEHGLPQVLDTCGTGGGIASFNISTATAIVVAAAGAKVAKHGNRSVTSLCGSADVLEALGVQLDLSLASKAALLRDVGLAFLFAPTHHSAMRHVGPARRELGFRTVFNQLGPLANPAGANRQLIGVYDASLLEPMAEAMRDLGVERGLVVHGEDGMDEVSPCGDTLAWRVWRGTCEPMPLRLADLGLAPVPALALAPGTDAFENGAILREAVSTVDSLRFAAILPSVAVTLWLAGLVDLPREGVALGSEVVASGAASRKLDEFVEATRA